MTKFILKAWVIIALIPIVVLSQEKAVDKVSIGRVDGVEHRFDPKQNQTSFSSIPFNILYKSATEGHDSLCREHTISLRTGFVFEGTVKTTKPDFIELRLYSRKLYRSFFRKEKNRQLIVIADKEKFVLGLMERKNSKNKNTDVIRSGGPLVPSNCPVKVESLVLKTPTEKLLRIVENKKIKIKIGELSMK